MNPWAAIVGRGGDGKRETTRLLVAALRARGLSVGGLLHEPIAEGEDCIGYDLIDVATGARRPLARVSSEPDLCSWAFEAETFAWGRARVERGGSEVLLLDANKLEANGHGHWPAIWSVLHGPPCIVLLVIRPHALVQVALKLDDPVAALELPATPTDVGQFVDALPIQAVEGG